MSSDPRAEIESIPILPLRNSVVFPASVVPINVGRARSVRLVEDLLGQDRAVVGIVSQKDADVDEPGFDDLYEVGTVARIVKVIRLGPSNYSVVLHGLARHRMLARGTLEPYMRARVKRIPEDLERDAALDALGQKLRDATRELLQLAPNLPKETSGVLDNVREAGALADLIASNLSSEQATVADKQKILETFDVKQRVEAVIAIIGRQLDLFRVKREISNMVADEGKTQRELILRQQMKSIREELGEGDDDDLEELRERVRLAGLSEDAQKIAKKQLGRMSGMQPQSAEYNVTRTYLEWLSDLPWSKTTPDKLDVDDCKRCLDEDHFGLDKVKKRIVEYIAVRKLRADKKGPILCFVGPPGVGKTSLGQSIAKATNRKFIRMSLGGVRDESEIRGHRRTYIGSMPGKILQNMSKVGVRNPLFLLDEVDKMGMDFRGDPASALLEVLDPEQNHTFQDHYVEVDFDLSDVMFVATSNSFNIPPALLDRMEVIRLSGYTEDEKVHISRQYLLPKQMKSNGVKEEELKVADQALRDITRYYTREAGVRGLEREIAKICRKVVKSQMTDKKKAVSLVTAKNLDKFLGVRRFSYGIAEKTNQIGQVTGLAWTEVGGELLTVEAAKLPGKGKVDTTGKLGEVMQESIKAAISVVRSRAKSLGIPEDFYEKNDLHIHLPEGATPKDGPSAGIAITTALVSVLSGNPVRCDVAMTGEITLRGEVLPIGGLKEKLLAAARGGIKKVLIPEENRKDLAEIPSEITKDLEIIPVKWIDTVLETALERTPLPLEEPVAVAPIAGATEKPAVTKH